MHISSVHLRGGSGAVLGRLNYPQVVFSASCREANSIPRGAARRDRDHILWRPADPMCCTRHLLGRPDLKLHRAELGGDSRMSGAAGASTPIDVLFPASWWGTRLEVYRLHSWTGWPMRQLPPVDPNLFTGDFTWLGGAGYRIDFRVAQLQRFAASIAESGQTTPADFITLAIATGVGAAGPHRLSGTDRPAGQPGRSRHTDNLVPPRAPVVHALVPSCICARTVNPSSRAANTTTKPRPRDSDQDDPRPRWAPFRHALLVRPHVHGPAP